MAVIGEQTIDIIILQVKSQVYKRFNSFLQGLNLVDTSLFSEIFRFFACLVHEIFEPHPLP